MKFQNTKILFYGGFLEKNLGGNNKACTTLIQSEILSNFVFFIIDSSLGISSVKRNFVMSRIGRMLKRWLLSLKTLLIHKPTIAIIFINDGLGFVEKGLYVFICRFFGCKVILSPRSGEIQENHQNYLFKAFSKRVFRSANILMVQGEFWKHYFAQYCESSKISVVENWISNDELEYEIPPFCVPKDNVIQLVFIGWLAYRKNIFCLLEAIAVCKNRNIKVHLDLYGEGNLRKMLEETIHNLGIQEEVTMKGWASIEDKKYIYKNHPILVLPSKFEGMPNIVLEAMARGLPIIASNIVTIPELIIHGENGLLFDPNNPGDLANCITKLGADYEMQQKFRNLSKQRSANFSLKNQSKKVLQLIESLT